MRRIFVMAVLLLASLGLYAQTQDAITLVVSGQGGTKEDATANALRSAIEQAYGVFVSANTQILNDEVVKDEIATVASGNVLNYEELSCVTMADGSLYVTLSATVSIGNLITYAKSHGSSAEFAGQTFTMNMRMRKLNTENEYKALLALEEQVAMLARHCFDYEIEEVDEPKVSTLFQVLRDFPLHIPFKFECSLYRDYFSIEDYVSAKSDFYYYDNDIYVNIDKLEQMDARYSINERTLYYEYEGTVHDHHSDLKKFNNGDIYCEVNYNKLKLPDLYSVRLKFKAVPNDNYKKVDSVISKTLGILCLTQAEEEAWHRNNMQTYTVYWNLDDVDNARFYPNNLRGNKYYVFRNSHSSNVLDNIFLILNIAACSWILDAKGLDFYYPYVRQIFGERSYGKLSFLDLNLDNTIGVLLCGRRDIKEIYIPPYLVAAHYKRTYNRYEKIRDLSQTVEFHLFEPSLYSVQGFDIKFSPELYEQGLRIINERSKE